MPIMSPSSPVHLCQPMGEAASTASRFLTDGGSTLSRYDWSCSSKSSQHGIDTTRVLMPCSSRIGWAPTIQLHFGACCHEDQIGVAAFSVGEDICAAHSIFGRGVFRAVDDGQFLARHDEAGGAVAAGEADLPGVDAFVGVGGAHGPHVGHGAQADSCSTGWWVGPSSPRPMLSWV